MANPFDKLFSHLKLKTDDGTKPTKMGYILIVALIGLLILIVSNMFQSDSGGEETSPLSTNDNLSTNDQETILKDKQEDKSTMVKDLEESYEKDLTTLLEQIQGVADVEVMVNLESTKQKVYEKDLVLGTQKTEEIDQNGGERYVEDVTEEQQVVIVRQGDQEVPLIVQTNKPEVRGVLVVAQGVDHMEIKQWVVESVSRVLDVPSHRISVMPKNNREE
ncbi:stage III sporulation protein AG [Aquibacillus sediminis]|uniref:stage III sporulation protein AG n=1 Tax=Aquibacillus sediminis TaxID=2574734 RepID=UPI001FEC3705|nr:stage III sporulation protein AG [Aquibacillus sediminis]